MIHYPLSFRFHYISPSIRKIETRLADYAAVCKDLAYFEEHRFRLEQQPGMLEKERQLLDQKRFLFENYESEEAKFMLYKRNSTLPSFLLYRNLFVHQGRRMTFMNIVKKTAINKKLGQFSRTKSHGTLIHKNNKIYKKLKKKMKQLAAKALQRKARKQKLKLKKKKSKK